MQFDSESRPSAVSVEVQRIVSAVKGCYGLLRNVFISNRPSMSDAQKSVAHKFMDLYLKVTTDCTTDIHAFTLRDDGLIGYEIIVEDETETTRRIHDVMEPAEYVMVVISVCKFLDKLYAFAIDDVMTPLEYHGQYTGRHKSLLLKQWSIIAMHMSNIAEMLRQAVCVITGHNDEKTLHKCTISHPAGPADTVANNFATVHKIAMGQLAYRNVCEFCDCIECIISRSRHTGA